MEITKHALERGKERLNLNEKSFTKLATKALELGKTHAECKGRLKRYADKLWLEYKSANNIRFYGDNIFFFADQKLITVYQCPHEFHKHLRL